MESAGPETGTPLGGVPPGTRADEDMDFTSGGPELSQAELDAAAEEACKEAEEAEKSKKAQEAKDAKDAKAKAIMARMKAKTQPVGKVRICLPFHLLLDDLPATEKARARVVDAIFHSRNKDLATITNVAVISLPIAAAVRASDENAPTEYPMLEIIFATPEIAKQFMTDYPEKASAGGMVSSPAPQRVQPNGGRPIFKQVRFVRWPRDECGLKPGVAIWMCLAGYEINIPTITHTIGAHDGVVARGYLPNPSPLLLKADEPAKRELAEFLECFTGWEQAPQLLSLRKNLVPRDGGSINGADTLIPQGVFIDVLVKEGMVINVFPANLPENGNIRWALDDVLVLDFFHEIGAQPRPQQTSKRERKMLAFSQGQGDAPGPNDRHQRRKEGKKIALAGGKHNLPCKYYQQGSCRSGEFCKFMHVDDATAYARGESSGALGPQIAEIGEIGFGGGPMD